MGRNQEVAEAYESVALFLAGIPLYGSFAAQNLPGARQEQILFDP